MRVSDSVEHLMNFGEYIFVLDGGVAKKKKKKKAWHMFAQIASAVHYLQQTGLTHRDFKCELRVSLMTFIF